MEFKELEKGKISEVEGKILAKWKEENILEKTIENRKDNETWVFYDGPIYANAKPGIHHVLAKTIKDSFCKYKTMKGYKVLRKIGLDTHGLPIEVNVEKKLGFKTKADIEKFGIENFCRECNNATALNIDEVNLLTDNMGQFIDSRHPYVTCSNEFIESEWWLIKEIDKKGLIYYGNKVLPYCPRCGTELSANEVGQGYQEDSVNTVIVPFKIKDSDTYFLVWTTTPWTLMANVALCVNPDLEYIKVSSMGYKFIVAKSLANKVLGDDFEVLETYKGTDLVGTKYEQLMPFAEVEGKCFEVLADSYVTSEDGTGIVHIAPAYGEDDNRVCKENGIGFVNPVGKDGCYTTGPWKGTLVTDKDLEIEIIKWLKENDKLFKKIKLTHDYPHCWRCHSPLIYYSKPAWYIRTTEYKDKILEANKTVSWHPDYVGTKRFNNWLENMVDWGISRNRYWGCPMPIWICSSCGEKHVIGSIKELDDMKVGDIDVKNMELHRPYIDEVHIKCPKCNGIMNRVTDVMDVWFDSGAMPYAQFHYPFENKELFESQFPADFIAEGVDQTRGWFNSLICISTIVSGVSSFKNVVVNDMVLDSNGKKMSKSTGNIIDPIKIMEEYGADTVRWYMLYASPVWTPLKFDVEGLKEVHSKFFNPLRNSYNFFAIYANADKIIDINTCRVEYNDREDIDKWLLSKYNKLIKEVTEAYDEYDLNKVVKLITDFTSIDLSNWYIRRNRDRFWDNLMTTSKKSVYMTTYEVLEGLSKLIAPIASYTAEEIYTNLTGNISVHLSDFPVCNEELIDLKLEEKMDLVRDLISIGRNVREESKIKVRQPISEILLDKKKEKVIGELTSLIKEELNVKEVIYTDDLSTYMNFMVKPNFKEVGKIFGKNIKEFSDKLLELSNEDINKLENNETIKMSIDNTTYDITKDMVDIRISSKEGFKAMVVGNNFVILNTVITKELENEGLARETISKVQQLRKTMNFDITDRINMYIDATSEYKENIKDYLDMIKDETLTINVYDKDGIEDKVNINDYEVGFVLEKVSTK
ncbi:MAG: isoleucine--tRNA ligase [Bacilli bacterium]|nr:isoleucine--tRNA ligase [Clostridium sp.]MDY2804558.1 isoleucine--tRNA ligase [Bacilli bacterium]